MTVTADNDELFDAAARVAADPKISDPFEILARLEEALGRNIIGQSCEIDVTIRIELNIGLTSDD